MNKKSISKIMILFLCLIGNEILFANDSTSYGHKKEKSRVIAVALSYIPGLGHVYAGKPIRGLGFCAGGLATYYVTAAYVVSQSGDNGGSTGGSLAVGGLLIAMKAWELIDLFKCIDDYNKNSFSMGIMPNGYNSCALVLQYKF